MRTTRKLEFNRINEDKNILSNIKDGIGTNSLVQNSSSTNTASADQAFAIGSGTIAGYANQFVMGKFNLNKDKNLFEIGFGSDTTHRRNILELNQDGALTAQYVGITSDGLRFYNNSNNEALGINFTTPTTPTGRKAIKKFVFYDGTGDTSKKAEIEAKTLIAASCSIANAPVGTTDVIRKQEYDDLLSGATATGLALQLGAIEKETGKVYTKINAGSDDKYILPHTEPGVPKFCLGSGNFKFEEMWSKTFNGDLDGTAKRATYASADESKGTIEERLTNLGFRQLPADRSTGLYVSGASLNATLWLKANGTTRQGNRALALFNVTFGSSTAQVGAMFDFFGSNKAAISSAGFIPVKYRPSSTVITIFPYRLAYNYANGLHFQTVACMSCTIHGADTEDAGKVTLQVLKPTLTGISTTLSSISIVNANAYADAGYQCKPIS